MDTKYLYIDDERDSADTFKSTVEQAVQHLVIDYSTPKIFDYQIQYLIEQLDNYDGLILDWRLDQVAEKDGKRVAFRAGALAQEIRTRGSERTATNGKEAGLKELPIALWSTRERLDHSYRRDLTSSDLFDIVHDKEFVIDQASRVASELLSLAKGYTRISAARHVTFREMVGLTKEQTSYIDPRFLGEFDNIGAVSIHDLARFIFKQVVLTPGLLIDEQLLAARLGVDTQGSTDWPNLLKMLPNSIRYRGPFDDFKPMWWAPLVQDEWWYKLPHKSRNPLSSLNAQQRVDRLKACLALENLHPAEPIVPGYSSYFQTLDEISKRPLDPLDGVLLGNREPLPWQDPKYISIDAALQRRHELQGLRLHPAEVERINQLRKNRE